MKNKLNSFIEKSKKRHGEKYDYSKVSYVDSVTKVCIVCPEHGEFWQEPASHVRGCECPLCANSKRGVKTMTTSLFIEKAKLYHKGRYFYDKTEYVDGNTKVIITCPDHGDFEQLPFAHLQGQGCPKCSGRGLTNNEWIERFISVHGERYDYSETTVTKAKDKCKIICPEHGEFWQTPQKHLSGQGCPKCKSDKIRKNATGTFDNFVTRANEIHNNRYIYYNEGFVNLHSKIKIECRKHGIYKQLAYDHLNGHECPICGMLISKPEIEICEFLERNKIQFEKNDRKILYGKEIDIYIPSHKIAIEYDGLEWHNEKHKDKWYHNEKTEACLKQGIKLIHIFEDEYKDHRELVYDKLSHMLGINTTKPSIYGRSVKIEPIFSCSAREFLEANHIQGFSGASVFIGAKTKKDKSIVAVMGFKRNGSNGNWELVRFATDIHLNCPGVASKMFEFFVEKYGPNLVKSFADRRWTPSPEGSLYDKLGFVLESITKPDYSYVFNNNRYHKFHFRKKLLNRKFGLPLTMTESEMCDKVKAYRIWNCGLYRYVWKREE